MRKLLKRWYVWLGLVLLLGNRSAFSRQSEPDYAGEL